MYIGNTPTSAAITGAMIADGTVSPTDLTVGHPTWDDSGKLTVNSLLLGGLGGRITGDFSNATHASRVLFQTSVTNGGSVLGVIPNGTSTLAQLNLYSSSSDQANSSMGQLIVLGGNEVRLSSSVTGTGTYLPITFFTSGWERARIDVNGNLGIGTSSPSEKLHIYGANPYILLQGSEASAQTLYMRESAGGLYFGQYGVGTRMLLDSSGNLGIGTSSPGQKLTVAGGNIAITQSDSRLYGGDTAGRLILTNSDVSTYMALYGSSHATTPYRIQWVTNSTNVLTYDSSGNLGLGVTPSGWGTANRALQVGRAFVQIDTNGTGSTGFGRNAYQNNSWYYQANGYATMLNIETDGAFKFFTAPSGTAGNPITFTQAMTLNASGNLGLGTTSPFATYDKGFEIYGASNSGMRLTNSSYTAGFDFAMGSDGTAYVLNRNNAPITFGTNGTERARIDSSGNLLVGKTSLSASTVGPQLAPSGQVDTAMASSSSAQSTWNVYSTGAAAYRFYVDMAGTIHATSTSIAAISDRDLKENIRDLETGLPEVMALKPRRFDWKNGDAQNVAGFIAQELEEVLPELVYDYKYNDTETKKSIKMGDILPTLVKAIQEQQALIQQLQADVAELKGQA